MNSDNPHLQAFEFNLRRILRERDFGKAAALVSNLCPNASDPQSIGKSSEDNARYESPCGTSSQSDLEDLPDDNETSSEWKFEGDIYFEAGRWPAGKTYEDAVREAAEHALRRELAAQREAALSGLRAELEAAAEEEEARLRRERGGERAALLAEEARRQLRAAVDSGGGAICTNCSCSCSSHGIVLQFCGRTRQGIVETD